jgi:hypothetical protein
MRFWAGGSLVGAVAVLAIGCGSNGRGSSALTQEAFVKQGNSICEEGLKEKDQILNAGFKRLAKGPGEPAKKDVESLILEIIPPLEDMAEQLGELRPPEKDQKVVEGFIREWEEAVQKAKEDPGSAISPRFLEAPNLKASKYGLTSCNL